MRRFVGLMSGTSLDGLDAALLRRDDAGAWALEAFSTTPYSDGQRDAVMAVIGGGPVAATADLHLAVAAWSARAVLDLLERAGVDAALVEAIGSHGQTVWHRPPDGTARGVSFQLGDPATLAARTGIGVVSDFRAADVAAGGQGAPLVPWPDRELFSVDERSRIVLNIGGMANLTWLPPRGGDEVPVAFDTGPGNVLIDAAAAWASDGRDRCDLDGARAARGRVDPGMLEALLADPFFEMPPPRSTGRERFGPERVAEWAARSGPVVTAVADDWIATYTALTARSIADAIAAWVLPRPIDEVVVAGGGAHNPTLIAMLADALRDVGVSAPLRTGKEALGMDPDAREAAAFAVLAWAFREGKPANLPAATGAAGPRVLGSWTPAPRNGTDR